MKIKNGKIIRTLTARSLKAGKWRNIIAIIAIALTAILFTTVFTIGSNLLASMQNATMRQVGTSAHGGMKYLTQEQYDHFKQSPMIKDISYNIIISFAENEALQKKQTEIRYSEDDCAKWNFSYPTVGNMPKEKNELACSTITLDMLGIPHELGQKVPLEFTVHGTKYIKEFTLCGFWPGDNVIVATEVFLSRAYTDTIVSVPENPDWKSGTDNIAGTINADVWFNDSLNIEGQMTDMIAERGYDVDAGEIRYGVNWAYAGSAVDITSVFIMGLIIILILSSGYLIIYSIFTISVTGDIRFYGLLKTIGTTGKQLRGIVRGQALFLSVFGIPLGLITGYLLGCGLTPALMSMTAVEGDFTAPLNPLIFIFAAAFSLVTVFISCRKPGRIAARVAPVEAVRYTDTPQNTGKKKAKRTGKVSPFSMAWANARRNPKKLAVIVVSLSLSMILLNSVYSMVRGFDMDTYLKNMILSDFSAADHSIYSPMSANDNFEGVDSGFLSGISALEGLEDMANIYFHDDYSHKLSENGLTNFNTAMDYLTPYIQKNYPYVMETTKTVKETGINTMHIYGVGKMAANLIADDTLIDFEKLKSGDYVLIAPMANTEDSNCPPIYNAGDKVTLANEAGDLREFEVLAVIPEYPYSLSCQHSHIINSEIFLADNVYLDFYGNKQPMMTIFDVADEYIPAAEKWVSAYCEQVNSSMDYRSRDYYKGEFENMQNTFLVLGGALSLILALIGVLNFLNAVVTSIFARRRELAMLQSVGMTGRQLQTMLFGEGITYAVLTILFTSIASMLLSFSIIKVMAGQIWFFTWNFTLTPLLYAILPLLAICAFVPLVCYRFMRRESVVDRLRRYNTL